MRNATVWAGMFGVEKSTVIDGVEFEDGSEAVVVSVRPGMGAKQRCGHCHRRCPRFDHGEGRRRWRGPDLGLLRSFLEAEAPRVTCRDPSATTRVRIAPTVRQAIRSRTSNVDFEVRVAIHATVSSNTRVCREPCRAHGTDATTTP